MATPLETQVPESPHLLSFCVRLGLWELNKNRLYFICILSEQSDTLQGCSLQKPLPPHGFDMFIACTLIRDGKWEENWLWRTKIFWVFMWPFKAQPYLTKSYSLIFISLSFLGYHWHQVQGSELQNYGKSMAMTRELSFNWLPSLKVML